ncbi:MAG: SDR family oxidoreductase [Gammaproteobacteria bacterium]|nr:SDR family oxidoreductase [Gammaproteobacteria bacterium]NIX86745.1 NAD-dependent epimerase/dehydratase family protein [Gammaproteobacteria bacterium]
MRVLVTGATGFVGRALCRELLRRGHTVVAAVRREAELPDGCETRLVAEIGPDTDWSATLVGIDAVAHLAARVHVMRASAADELAAYRRTNVEGTLRLARAAAQAGVERFVFLSSIKVMGEVSPHGPLTEADPPRPQDPYAVSKLEAERGLSEVAGRYAMGLVILRPPLVYGPGVKGHFHSLLRLVDRGVPLPLGAIDNRRSLLYLGNLADAIGLCLSHPAAPGKTFLLRDGEDLSTPDLVRRLAAALGRRSFLFSFPPSWLLPMARALGRGGQAERLLGSLCLEDRPIRQELGWPPPFTVQDGLRETAEWYRAVSS